MKSKLKSLQSAELNFQVIFSIRLRTLKLVNHAIFTYGNRLKTASLLQDVGIQRYSWGMIVAAADAATLTPTSSSETRNDPGD